MAGSFRPESSMLVVRASLVFNDAMSVAALSDRMLFATSPENQKRAGAEKKC